MSHFELYNKMRGLGRLFVGGRGYITRDDGQQADRPPLRYRCSACRMDARALGLCVACGAKVIDLSLLKPRAWP